MTSFATEIMGDKELYASIQQWVKTSFVHPKERPSGYVGRKMFVSSLADQLVERYHLDLIAGKATVKDMLEQLASLDARIPKDVLKTLRKLAFAIYGKTHKIGITDDAVLVEREIEFILQEEIQHFGAFA